MSSRIQNRKRGFHDQEVQIKVKGKMRKLLQQDSVSAVLSNNSGWNSNPSTPVVNSGVDLTGPRFTVPPSYNVQQQSAGGHSSGEPTESTDAAADEAALSPNHVIVASENPPDVNNNDVRHATDILQQEENQIDFESSPQTIVETVTDCLSQKTTDKASKPINPPTDKQLIKGVFEILHVTDDEEPTFIVRNVKTKEYGLCREIVMDKYRRYMLLYERFFAENCDEDEHVLQRAWPEKTELFMTKDGKCYHVSPRHYGTLHSHVIDKKKLSEVETRSFFTQICEIVAYCHDRGIVVRDIKLRKFVFVDEQKTKLRLDDLDEFVVCPTVDADSMSDRHGCPAYVSPEILDLSSKVYAGRSADVWGLGVLLYVLLMGRYPFYDTTPTGLFGKIRSAKFLLNEHSGVSLELRWLIRSLLRKSPEERPNVREILAHPWLVQTGKATTTTTDAYVSMSSESSPSHVDLSRTSKIEDNSSDQCVPCLEPVFVRTKASNSKLNACFLNEPRDQEVFKRKFKNGNQTRAVSANSLPSLSSSVSVNQQTAVPGQYNGGVGHRGRGSGPHHQQQQPPARPPPPDWYRQAATVAAIAALNKLATADSAASGIASGVANVNLFAASSSMDINETNDECAICMQSKIDCALYTCGHMCMCYTCAVETWQRHGFCPVCRQPIKDVIKIFKST